MTSQPLPEAVGTEEAARMVGLSPATLATLRNRGGGPPFCKLGRRVVYPVADLRAWLASRRVSSTAELAG